MRTELDFRELDRRASAAVLAVLDDVRPEQLELPTPCAGWTLHDLIAHMVAENRGFVAAFAGDGTLAAWRDHSLGDDPRADFAASAAAVTAVFAADDALERRVRIREFGEFPGRVAVRMHFVDNIVHAWDLTRTIGVESRIEPELAVPALEFMRRVDKDRPNAAFGERVEPSVDASPGDRLIAFLGREPQWRAA